MSHHTLITMTCGVSLDTWKKTGLLSRELGYYARLSQKTGEVSFLTYENNLENEYKLLGPFLPEANILSALASALVPVRFGAVLSSLLTCFLPLKKLKNIKLIRSNQFNGSWSGLVLAKRLKVPFILRCGYLYSQHYEKGHPKDFFRVWMVRNLERFVAKSADAIIVTYQSAKDHFVTQHGISPEKIFILGNPIDTELFRPFPEIEKTKDVISIGRLEEQKNYFALIEACKNAGLNLTLIGNGSLKTKLQDFASEIGADVEFVSPVPNEEIPLILARHKIFVLSSFYEGNPKSLLEALSSGIPCIASDIAENKLIVENQKEALICSVESSGILGSLGLLVSDASLVERLAKAGRQKIVDFYSQKVIAEKEALIHQNLLKRPESRS